MSISAFTAALKSFVSQHETQAAAARAMRVSPQYLHDVLEARREPGKKILRALKWEKVVTYQPK